MKFIGYMKGLSEGLAYGSDDVEFEIKHLHDVAYFSEKLAIERNLDPNIALVIAYGHDYGRLKEHVYGKEHSKVGAEAIQSLLLNSEFSTEEQKWIVDAIKHHGKKNKRQGLYSELIKDADSLAHNEEGLIEASDCAEHFRIVVSSLESLKIECAPIENWIEAFDLCRKAFVENLETLDSFKSDPNNWVHDQRILIRKLRSMIWYFKKAIKEDTRHAIAPIMAGLIQLDGRLKNYFATLSKARRLFCFVEKETENKPSKLKSKLSKSLKSIEATLVGATYKPLVDNLNDTFEDEVGTLADCNIKPGIWDQALLKYIKKASYASTHRQTQLHQTRINGKKFKYMLELELITISSEDLTHEIMELHDIIGKLNDYKELMKINNWEKTIPKKTVKKDVIKTKKKCEETLFFFKLLDKNYAISTDAYF